VTQLDADGGLAVLVDEVDDAPPRPLLFFVPQAGAPGGDAGACGGAGHLGHHQPGSADGPTPQVHEVPLVRDSVDGAVLGHRGDPDPVAEVQLAEPERVEHRGRIGVGGPELAGVEAPAGEEAKAVEIEYRRRS